MEPVVYLITGPMAAGKTTVARLLASRFPRGVHVEGDLFRRSIVSGREEVTPELRPEAMEQLRLRCRLAAAAADIYAEAGFTVALEDVVAGPLLGDYRTDCARHREQVASLGLDTLSRGATWRPEPVPLRWILFHLIEETARHNGHIDILREMADGVTGS